MLQSIFLIGMPGSGKSTLGKLYSDKTGQKFIDTDELICDYIGEPLQTWLNKNGYKKLRAVEESIILGIEKQNAIIATGGSAVYSATAMKHLQDIASCIYLSLSLQSITKRVSNFDTRGIANPPEDGLEAIFKDRASLYKKYANHTLYCDDKNIDQVVNELINLANKKF